MPSHLQVGVSPFQPKADPEMILQILHQRQSLALLRSHLALFSPRLYLACLLLLQPGLFLKDPNSQNQAPLKQDMPSYHCMLLSHRRYQISKSLSPFDFPSLNPVHCDDLKQTTRLQSLIQSRMREHFQDQLSDLHRVQEILQNRFQTLVWF